MATEISVLETIGISAKLFKELNLTVQGAKFFLKDEADVGYLIRDFEDDLSDCETVLSTWAGKNVSIQGGDGLCEATRHLQVIDFHGAQLALILKPLATVDGRVLSQLQRVERNLHRNHQVTDEMLPVRAVLIRSHESTQDSTPLAAYQGSLEQTPKGLILRDKVAFVRENSDTISQIINELRRNVQDLHAYPLSTSLADDDCTENAPPLYSSIKIQPSSQPSSSATDVCHKIATTLQDLLDRTAVSPTFSHYERPPNLLFNAFTDSDLESRLEDWAEEIHLSSGTLELMWTDDSTGIYHRVKGYLERIAKELENVQRIIKVYGKQDWIGCSNLEAKSKIVENSHLEIQKLVTRLLDYVPWIKNHPAFETVKNDPFADGSGVFGKGFCWLRTILLLIFRIKIRARVHWKTRVRMVKNRFVEKEKMG
jgi:hypothetical protein